jgi:primosomal protein N'
MKPIIAEVSIPISFARDDVFDYRVSEESAERVRIGTRVLVPFRTSVKTGYVTRIKDHSRYASRLKTILKVLDDHPLIDASLLSLADHLQQYYFCSQASTRRYGFNNRLCSRRGGFEPVAFIQRSRQALLSRRQKRSSSGADT